MEFLTVKPKSLEGTYRRVIYRMSYDNWQNDTYAKKWLNQLTEANKRNTVEPFEAWLNFIKMSPTEQIMKRMKDLRSDNPQVRGFFEDKLIEFMHLLETQSIKSTTIHRKLSAIRSFFTHNRLKLQFARGQLRPRVNESEKVTQEWILANEEIRALYSVASVRNRALLLCLYQSGFSPIDVSKLNIEHLRQGQKTVYETEDHLYIDKLREKTSIHQKTCVSSECVFDIQNMLKERGSPKTGALFVSEKGMRLSPRFINDAMKSLCEKAHGKQLCKEFKTKNLRDSYNDALLRADIKQELKDVLMGHKRLGARGHYHCSPTTIKETYQKAFKSLSINHGTQTKQALKQVQQSIIGLSQTIAKQQDQINELRGKLESFFKALDESPYLIKETTTPNGKKQYLLIKTKKIEKPKNWSVS